jgi:hypothetical protein
MANEIFETKTIALQDGTEVTLRPLVIVQLRKFLSAWEEFNNVKEDADGFDVFINCAGIALENELRGVAQLNGVTVEKTSPTAAEKAKGAWLSKEYKEYLETVLDLDTIYAVLETGGVKLNDPKLMEEAEALAGALNED